MKLRKYIKKFAEVILLNRGYVEFLGKRKTLVFVILAVLTSLLNSLNYIALIPLVSVVVDGASPQGGGMLGKFSSFLPSQGFSIYVIGAVVIAAFIFKFLINILFSHLSGFYSENYMFFLRQRMMKTMTIDYYNSGIHAPSQIMHYNNMVTRVGSFNWASFSMMSKVISSVVLFASLFLVEFKLAAYSILFVIFWAAILMPVLKFTRRIAAEYSSSLHRVQVFLKDEIEGKEIIQIFNLSPARDIKLSELQKDAVRGNAFLSDIRAVVANLQEFVVVILGVILLCFAYTYKLQIGYLIAYGYVFSKFITSLNEVSTYLNNALEVMPPTQEIIDYVKPANEVFERRSQKYDSRVIDQLEYLDLDFSWGDQPLFRVEHLNLKRNDKTLITGKNGVGKSTLLKVMAGLIRSKGFVSVNGDPRVELEHLRDLHPRFSYIPQNSVVFEGTLVDNILLNSQKAIEDIELLSSKLSIDLNDYFKNWKSFKIQEDGNNLSGGEMQIVSIFRALIRDSDVIFVDEFSNHLSDRVTRALDRYFSDLNDKIIVCVSHSQFQFPNKILQVENARISVVH